jgi:hypothetical protein
MEVYELTGAAELRGRLHVAQPRLITSRRISAIQISAVARQAPLLLVVVSGLCSCGRPHVIGRDAQAIFRRRRHQPRPPIRMKIRPQLSVALRPLRLRTIHRAENIASTLKRAVNICQRQFVNEVLGPLVTEFIRNFGGEDATPIQHAFPTAAFSITSRLVKFVRHSASPKGFNQLPGRPRADERRRVKAVRQS